MSPRSLVCGFATVLVACGQVAGSSDDSGDDDDDPGFSINLIVDPGPVFVRTGDQLAIEFTLERTGAREPVTVALASGAPGVLAEPVTVAADSDAGQIILQVAATTAIQRGPLVFTATEADRTAEATTQLDILGAAGAVDPTFGSGGILPIDLGVNESPVFAIDQGDKVVIGVVIKRDGRDGIRVVRRALDGTADPSFGSAGEAFLDVSTLGLAGPQAGAVAQADGKIVVAGAASNGSDLDPFIVRLTADGQIDSALALRKIDSTTANLGFSAIDVGPGGELVIAGTKSLADTSDLYFLRLDSTGARDPGFGANGLATFHDLKLTQVSSFVIQTDGRIVGLVQTLNGNGFDVPQFALRRFGTDGALDTTFGTAGKATLPTPEGLAFANTLASPDRLNLFVGGSARGVLVGNSDTAVWKFASDGRLDLTFGGGIGYYVAAPTATPADSVSRLVFAADGSIYGVGSESESFSLINTLLLHLEANGAPATDFGDGIVRHPAAALTTRAAYLRADHRLILVMAPIFPADANDTVLEAFFQ